jgi:hypothetical protein
MDLEELGLIIKGKAILSAAKGVVGVTQERLPEESKTVVLPTRSGEAMKWLWR